MFAGQFHHQSRQALFDRLLKSEAIKKAIEDEAQAKNISIEVAARFRLDRRRRHLDLSRIHRTAATGNTVVHDVPVHHLRQHPDPHACAVQPTPDRDTAAQPGGTDPATIPRTGTCRWRLRSLSDDPVNPAGRVTGTAV